MFKNLKWSAFASISRYLIQTLSIVILARLISPDSFGVISALLIIVTMSYFISQAGSINLVVSCFIDDLPEVIFKSIIISFVLSISIYFVVYFFSVNIVSYLNIDGWQLDLKIVMLSIIFRSLTSPFEGYLVRCSLFSIIAKIEFLSYFFGYFCVSVILAHFGYEEKSLVFAIVIQSLLSFILYVYSYNIYGIKIKACFSGILNQAKRSLNFSGYQFFSSISGQVDNLIISKYMGTLSLGLYSRAYQLTVVPCNFFGQIVNRVFLSTFSDIKNQDKCNVKIKLKRSILFVYFASFFVTLFLFFFVGDFIDFILGDGWDGLSPILLILSFSIFPRLIYKINEPILLANNQEKKALASSLFYILLLFLFCFAAKDMGLEFIALSVVVGTYIYSFLMSILVVFLIPYVGRYYFATLSSSAIIFVFWILYESPFCS